MAVGNQGFLTLYDFCGKIKISENVSPNSEPIYSVLGMTDNNSSDKVPFLICLIIYVYRRLWLEEVVR